MGINAREGDSLEDLRFSDFCANCRKSLAEIETILFVEKEVGRCFCSEECIHDYFQPAVDAMLEEHDRLRSRGDYGDGAGERFSQYRALTLEDPDEVWLNETDSGERHFTFMSKFRSGEDAFTYVCVCLTIEGVPSFVFLGFATRDEDLVEQYRRGTEIPLESPAAEPEVAGGPEDSAANLADAAANEIGRQLLWEKLFAGEGASSSDLRRSDDIPREQFDQFVQFIEPTMDDPDEIWSFVDPEKQKWLTFISIYKDHEDEETFFSMIVVCRLFENGEMQMVSAFPTIDPDFAQKFRRGVQSVNKAYGVGWTRGNAA